MIHKPVLLHEAIESLNLKKGAIYFDGTLGGGGHAKAVCSMLDHKVRVIAVDRDSRAIDHAETELSKIGCEYSLVLSNYRDMDKVFGDLGIAKVDAILLDLGLSSDQLENSGRGFSFKNDEPLLMTFEHGGENRITAKDIVNGWKEETLADIFYGYADERYARRLARTIVEARKEKEIKTTHDLVEIIRQAVPKSYEHGKIHFATKTFQALRMAVNDEIGSVQEGMKKGWQFLSKGGRMAIISFHSIEDREVKHFYQDRVKQKEGKFINKKPIIASRAEIIENPRARSAKLRVIEKIV